MLQPVVLAPAKPAQRRRHRCRSVVRAAIQTLEQRRLFAAPTVTAPDTELFEDWLPLNDGHFHFQVGPQHLEAGFDQPVNVANDALALTNLTTGTPYTDLAHSGSGSTHTWTVTGADNQGVLGGPLITGALPRGNYELAVTDIAVTNAAGETLDGNTYVPANGNPDGESGDDYLSSFFVMPGDHNRDRVVDGADLGQLDNYVQFPGTGGYMNGDYNYDGSVTLADYAIAEPWVGTALPEPPTQANALTAAAGRGFVDLMWTPPADADIDGFKIYRSLDAGDTWTLHHTLPNPAATTWRDTGLDDGRKYTYRIRAYRETGIASEPISYSVTTNKYWTVTNLPGPLDAPIVSDVTQTSLRLTWSDNTTTEAGFTIERANPDGTTTLYDVPSSAAVSTATGSVGYNVTGLTAATAYTFRVRGYTAAQDSAWSLPAQATTLPSDPMNPPPAAPTNLTATRTPLDTGSETLLEWSDNSDEPNNEQGFHVHVSTDGGQTFAQFNAGADAQSHFNDFGPFVTCLAYVTAWNQNGVSAPSNTISFTTTGSLDSPSGLAAEMADDDGVGVLVTWSYNSPHGQAFELQRKAAADATWEPVATLTPDVREYLDEAALTPDTTYTYRAKATRSTPEWVESAWVQTSVKVPPVPEPTGLTAKSVSPSEINLMWVEKATGEDGFVVQMSNDGGETFTNRATLPPNARHYSAVGLAPETTYEFRVATTRGGHLSEYSSVASTTTRPLPEEDPDGDPTNNPPPPLDPGWWEPVDSVTPDIMDASTEYFAGGESLEPGSYRVMYESGGVDFKNDQYGWWGSAGYVVTPSGEVLPGSAVHASEEAVELAMANQGVSVGHAGGPLGVSFGDSKYDDNEGSGVTWRLERYHPPEPPPQPPVDDPNTNDTDEGPSTISISVNPEHAVATEGGEDYIELVFSRGTGQSGKKRPKVEVYYTLAGTATPQEDYTGPTGGTGFAGVYMVTIAADQGLEDPQDPTIAANDGVFATVEVRATDVLSGSSGNDQIAGGNARSFFAAIRATGTYLFTWMLAQGQVAPAPRVSEVTFSATDPNMFNEIIPDRHINADGTPDETAKFGGPQWKDTNGDGDADDAGDNKFPLAYTRSGIAGVNVVPKVDVKFSATGPQNGNYMVKGAVSGDGSMSLPPTAATMNSGVLSASLTANGNTPTSIDKLDFTIDWQVSADGGATWQAAGTTSNRTYISNIDLTNPAVETVLDIGCRNAKGLTQPADVLAAIWNDFEDPTPGVLRADGVEMLYWGPASISYQPHTDTYAGLIKLADGQCGGWARLLVAVLATQGVASQLTKITLNANSAPATHSTPYGFLVFKGTGHKGQGNTDQMFEFTDHAIVEVGSGVSYSYLDPSYGSSWRHSYTPDGQLDRYAEERWEDYSVDKLVFLNALATSQMVIENPSGVDDVTFAPTPFNFSP